MQQSKVIRCQNFNCRAIATRKVKGRNKCEPCYQRARRPGELMKKRYSNGR